VTYSDLPFSVRSCALSDCPKVTISDPKGSQIVARHGLGRKVSEHLGVFSCRGRNASPFRVDHSFH